MIAGVLVQHFAGYDVIDHVFLQVGLDLLKSDSLRVLRGDDHCVHSHWHTATLVVAVLNCHLQGHKHVAKEKGKSREWYKSAPRLRLKNSKRISKVQVLSSTEPEKPKGRPKWRAKRGTLRDLLTSILMHNIKKN